VFSTTDTIVAIATPAGRGGLGVVRLSGPEACAIACRLLGRDNPLVSRRATFGRLIDPGTAGVVDEVVTTWFDAPRSYTCEDVVEISTHGSPPILERVVTLAVQEGARLAEPGEFTLRAHLNGRLDLVQAEAVVDIVDAVTPLQARAAVDQLQGTLTTRIAGIDAVLFDLVARLEASIDFPDEGFHFITPVDVARELDGVLDMLGQLQQDGRAGRMIREGALAVIAGRPNAGKSSLFNALVGSSRAIVTDLPGTTRDTLAERVDLAGIPVTLVDTAGLREPGDAIEAEGIRRASEARAAATLTLIVLDGSIGIENEDLALVASSPNRLVVVSKCDLDRAWTTDGRSGLGDAIPVSVATGAGLDELRARMARALTESSVWSDPPAISNIRHLALVDQCCKSVGMARAGVAAGVTEEVVLAELSEARVALESITGRRSSEDLLRYIFGRFCIGK
jgi:tRNA modification GTPase